MCSRTKSGRAQVDGSLKVDRCLWPFVRLLRRRGVGTIFSCCGHNAERPTVTIRSVDLGALHSALRGCFHWVREIRVDRPSGETCTVEFEAVVCTPPRLVPWGTSPGGWQEHVRQVAGARRAFGFRRRA